MAVAERAKNMMVKPAETWLVVEQEITGWSQLYLPYLAWLAAIPAVAGLVGWTLVGMGGFGVSLRLPLGTGLAMMISQYIMTLVMVAVWGWVINLLAGSFGGQANLMNAVKLSVYASTPAMVAGVFNVIPSLAILGLLGGLYALYLLYLGLPVLMKNPAEKSLPYAAVAAVVGIVGSVLISAAGTMLLPSPMSPMHSASGVAISTPEGEVNIDMKKIEALTKRLQAEAEQEDKP
ncbi:Yip1 family protein [Rhodoferax sp.]|uniref:Yip1 family protein n=1 Tax=Rhodoferax sp. TaxID=50421 RepID=UPI002602F19F|nr:Yip1 family protein [Rhodoferax sp.]MDD2924932.1 Yip1 family protein [Rhodoferax sp.]